MAVAVAVRDLGKRYSIAHEAQAYGRITESLTRAAQRAFRLRASRRSTEQFWALRNVSFEVSEGEVLGIVGRNGAGKSTLLKLLSRITEPTEGSAFIHGRVGSLLDVGTGFHPELTGRENVFLSGSILGMKRREIEARFDEIVAFAEVERFLDVPVKRYSSGMQVRLGFGVAAHLAAPILIVDEVLAVGDAAFQKRCLAKMEDVTSQGRTVLFVSHNMAAVEGLCTSAILLQAGEISARGSTHEVIEAYLKGVRDRSSIAVANRTDRTGDGRIRINDIAARIRTGAPSEIRLGYAAESDVRDVAVTVGVLSTRGDGVLFAGNEISGDPIHALAAGSGELVCQFDSGPLLPGEYALNVYVTASGTLADWVTEAAMIEVDDGDFYGTGKLPPPGYGSLAVPYRWRVERA